MSDPLSSGSLPTSLWLDAKLHLVTQRGGSYYILNKGPAEGGAVLVKVYVPGAGAQIFSQFRDMDGNLQWMDVFEHGWVEEPEADAYIRQQIEFDPDLWAVEIESRIQENPLMD